ncbi:MAG TPA: hypothetical protein VEF34_04840 [Syntrophobacteraceae bacterium]|nr:hypothetical protein [Syntrophobacteraceae bacterium]
MKKPNNPKDVNKLAAFIADQATSDPKPDQPEIPQKNPAAIALGRLGGKKGGKARAAVLSAERKHEIARKAALARWNRTREEEEK